MLKSFLATATLAGALVTAAFATVEAAPVRVQGSTTVAGLLEPRKGEVEGAAGVELEIRGVGSSRGIAALVAYGDDGTRPPLALAVEAMRRPAEWPALIALARRSRTATTFRNKCFVGLFRRHSDFGSANRFFRGPLPRIFRLGSAKHDERRRRRCRGHELPRLGGEFRVRDIERHFRHIDIRIGAVP